MQRQLDLVQHDVTRVKNAFIHNNNRLNLARTHRQVTQTDNTKKRFQLSLIKRPCATTMNDYNILVY